MIPAPAVERRADTAAYLARLGGRMALDHLRDPLVSWKPDDSMVTDVDVAIQQRIAKEIQAAFPADVVVGEEGQAVPLEPAPGRCVWVIDPIDGTNNFGRGLPGFSVSIGVLDDGSPLAGAVCDPMSDMLFTARRGGGAALNGEPIAVRPLSLSRRSLFAIRSPFETGVPPVVVRWLERYRLRRFGSTALHLCYVALGGLAFVHDDRASLWDVAGAAAVLLEAGGAMTRPDGTPLFPLHGAALAAPLAFVAGDPQAHAAIVAEIAAAT
jgi:myo-inositol-1(or 4)-monophosphatase